VTDSPFETTYSRCGDPASRFYPSSSIPGVDDHLISPRRSGRWGQLGITAASLGVEGALATKEIVLPDRKRVAKVADGPADPIVVGLQNAN